MKDEDFCTLATTETFRGIPLAGFHIQHTELFGGMGTLLDPYPADDPAPRCTNLMTRDANKAALFMGALRDQGALEKRSCATWQRFSRHLSSVWPTLGTGDDHAAPRIEQLLALRRPDQIAALIRMPEGVWLVMMSTAETAACTRDAVCAACAARGDA
jgi:hypothetical protein